MKTDLCVQQVGGWPTATLDSICTTISSGGTPKRMTPGYYVASGGFPWVKTQELQDRIIHDTDEHISQLALDNSSAKVYPAGTLLVAMYAAPTAGRMAILGKPMACNQAACALVIDPTMADVRYVFYQLLFSRPDLHRLANGAAQQNLSARVLRELEIVLPSLPEQRRIAGVLGAFDDLIEVNQRLARSCEELATSLVLRTESRVLLSELACASKAKPVTPSGSTDHYSLPAFDVDRLPECVDGAVIKSNKTPLSEPVVLVSRLNPHIPRVWMVYPRSGVLSAASTEFVPVVGTSVNPEEVWALCASPGYLEQMGGLVTGTTGSHQRVDRIALLTVEVPDVRSLPNSTREAVVLAVQEAHSARSSIRELAAARDELLPLLMSGRVRVGDVAA